MAAVEQHGMRLLVDSVDGSMEDAYMDLVRDKRIDGLVLIDAPTDDRAILRLTKDDFPVITLGYHYPEFCSVDVDNQASSWRAVMHLIEQGHTRIGCITNYSSRPAQINHRLVGYKKAMQTADIGIDETLIEDDLYSPESGLAAMNRLLAQHEKLTVTSDVVVAFGAMQAIQVHGLCIPEDIAIVGFDDYHMARYCTPPLSTVHVPAYEMGYRVGELLFARIGGQPADKHVVLDTELVIRASSQNL